MNITIYTPKAKLFENLEAIAVYLPGASGDMEILNNHIPVLTSLKNGTLKVSTKSGQTIEVHVAIGYAQYADNQMTIVVQETSLSHEEIERIQNHAESLKDKTYKKDNITEEEFEHFEDSERGR